MMLKSARIIAASILVLFVSVNAFAETTVNTAGFFTAFESISNAPSFESVCGFDSDAFAADTTPAIELVPAADIEVGVALAIASVPCPGLILLGAVSTGFIGWVRGRRSL